LAVSFDLAVWEQSSFITKEHAVGVFERATSGDPIVGFEQTGRLARFSDELFRIYPDLDALTERRLRKLERTDSAKLVWSVGGLDKQVETGFLYLCIQWSKARDVLATVVRLAGRHDVLVFDPQEDGIHYPPGVGPLPHPVLGDVVSPARYWGVTEGLLRQQLGQLSEHYWFVTIDRDAEEQYAQVAVGSRLAAQGAAFPTGGPPDYVLEVRRGSEDEHYRTGLDDLPSVERYLVGYLRGDDSWQASCDWQKVAF
jgi:hypothetical protein